VKTTFEPMRFRENEQYAMNWSSSAFSELRDDRQAYMFEICQRNNIYGIMEPIHCYITDDVDYGFKV
jgi:hypothetical protein